jgi:hypothetical protein
MPADRRVLWLPLVVLAGTVLLVGGLPRACVAWVGCLGTWGFVTLPLAIAAVPLALFLRADRRRRRAAAERSASEGTTAE